MCGVGWTRIKYFNSLIASNPPQSMSMEKKDELVEALNDIHYALIRIGILLCVIAAVSITALLFKIF
jgi:hypothetical protein